MSSISAENTGRFVGIGVAAAMTGLAQHHLERIARKLAGWREGDQYRVGATELEIDIAAFERWVEFGAEVQQAIPEVGVRKARRALDQGITRLYRHFDSDGQLLYVGISLGVMHRLQQHLGSSSWAASIARVEVATFTTRTAAMQAERLAIQTEKPLHNIIHASRLC